MSVRKKLTTTQNPISSLSNHDWIRASDVNNGADLLGFRRIWTEGHLANSLIGVPDRVILLDAAYSIIRSDIGLNSGIGEIKSFVVNPRCAVCYRTIWLGAYVRNVQRPLTTKQFKFITRIVVRRHFLEVYYYNRVKSNRKRPSQKMVYHSSRLIWHSFNPSHNKLKPNLVIQSPYSR